LENVAIHPISASQYTGTMPLESRPSSAILNAKQQYGH
jgi:hypothetical protein